MGTENWGSILDMCSSEKVKKYIRDLPKKRAKQIEELLPSSGGYRENKDLINVLARLLIFKPDHRIKVEEALEHLFLKDCRQPATEIDADFTYDDKLTFENEGNTFYVHASQLYTHSS